MAIVTLRILDGADRGRVYDAVATPISIGREEGNSIQLNDERVSRFHIKIQEDRDKVVLTDLQSTNGTKVNGEDVQLRILRYGDLISVGRSVLLFGSREQIARRLSALRKLDPDATGAVNQNNLQQLEEDVDIEVNWENDSDERSPLFKLVAPELPEGLSPGQAAELSELLGYLHIRLRDLIGTVQPQPQSSHVTLEFEKWQTLLELQSRLAGYLRSIGEPDEE